MGDAWTLAFLEPYKPPPFYSDDVLFEVWCERGDEVRTFEEWKEWLYSTGVVRAATEGA